jgi:hypothetical protein
VKTTQTRKRSVVRWLLILLGVPAALLVLAVLVVVLWLGSTMERPVLRDFSADVSPDGRWQATLERIENRMGFGLGREYYEVHILRSGARATGHIDDHSVAFSITTESAAGDLCAVTPPRVEWVDGRHLRIEYHPAMEEPGKKATRIGDVDIEYKRVERVGDDRCVY